MVKGEYSLLFTADVHGNQGQITAALKRAEQLGLDAIVFGGDIAPKEGNLEDGAHWKPNHKTRNPEAQRSFYHNFMIPIFSRYSRTGFDVFAMMGNDDFRVNMDILEEANASGKLRLLHDREYQLPNGLWIVGTSWVDITPFLNKDWEKHDTTVPDEDNKEKRRIGYVADLNGGIGQIVDFNSVPTTDSLKSHLFGTIQSLSPPDRTIYVFHAPPYNTNLDQVIRDGQIVHLGSMAVRRYFEKIGGLLGLHGHIHETVAVSGEFQDNVGNVKAASPGNSPYESPTNNYTNYRNNVAVLIIKMNDGRIDVQREKIHFDSKYNIIQVK